MIEEAWAVLSAQFASNEFLQGGALLGVMGMAAASARSLPKKVWNFLKRRLLVELDIQQGNYAFEALVYWMSEQPYARRTRRQTAVAEKGSNKERDRPFELMVSPAPGIHLVLHGGWPYLIHRGRERSKGDSGLFVGFYESFTVTTFGRRDGPKRLLQDALNMLCESERGGSKILLHDGYRGWDSLDGSRIRPLESVVLPGHMMEDLVEDLQWFLGAEDFYTEVGVPYRRGYLLIGPPGTGKTSACIALATHFGLDLAVVSLSSGKLDDNQFAASLQNVPNRTTILLEDVDCLYDEDRKRKNEAGGVTLSGLLNALDGAVAQEGRAFFLTTNHPEKLDPALRRPGRADVVVELGLADTYQLARLYLRFFPDAGLELVDGFAQAVGDRKATPAEVQQWLMVNRDDPDAAVNYSPIRR